MHCSSEIPASVKTRPYTFAETLINRKQETRGIIQSRPHDTLPRLYGLSSSASGSSFSFATAPFFLLFEALVAPVPWLVGVSRALPSIDSVRAVSTADLSRAALAAEGLMVRGAESLGFSCRCVSQTSLEALAMDQGITYR